MPVLRSRSPQGTVGQARLVSDPDILISHLSDAAHFTGGHAEAMAMPESEAAVAAVLSQARAVLPIGAQSSLTGGATPMGEVLLSTARLNRIGPIDRNSVHVEAGVPLTTLDEALAAAHSYYPPAPTFMGAFVGGTIATNAAGAATFKYGATRAWVHALTVVLASGDVLDIDRGATLAHPDGYFELELLRGRVRVPVPRYRMPIVAKLSAGYFAAPGMDLIDLFIGAEGTLGVITSATLRIVTPRPAWCLALVPFEDWRPALALTRELIDRSRDTWRRGDPSGVDASAIEYMDKRSLALLREDGADRALGVDIPDRAAVALLITLELPPGMSGDRAYEEIGRGRDAEPPDTPLTRFCSMLADAGVLDDVAIAVPGDHARAAQLLALREAVPAAVNQRVARAKAADGRIEKTAADMIVPVDRLEEVFDLYDGEFRRRGLDAAVWGHLSDGNLHPNVIPRTLADVSSGREAILTFGREVARLGGAPLAEHGVGRSPVKQQLLRDLYGDEGIDDMRRVKHALDPEWKLAPGVLFGR